MKDIEKLLIQTGVLPDSPIGRLVVALDERIARLEAEVLPHEPQEDPA